MSQLVRRSYEAVTKALYVCSKINQLDVPNKNTEPPGCSFLRRWVLSKRPEKMLSKNSQPRSPLPAFSILMIVQVS